VGGGGGGVGGYFMTPSVARLYTIDSKDDTCMMKWKGLGRKSMLNGSLVTTACRVLRLRVEEAASR
jgi:hypothetical protein